MEGAIERYRPHAAGRGAAARGKRQEEITEEIEVLLLGTGATRR